MMAKAEQESISIPDQSHQGLINDLMYIGFTQNEARTFMALISHESASASILVKKTGIRDSKIYQVLDRLEKKGFVTVQEGTPKKYMVIHPTTPLE
jgi:sugar-specific transcriptional regulator TrmB